MPGPALGPTGRFGFVDDLRGLAALAVAISHMVWLLPGPLPELEIGRVGVEVFFVISGFVMAYTLERERVTPRFAGQFMARRSIRLDLPYWVSLALEMAVLLVIFDVGLPSWENVAVNSLYLQDLLEAGTISEVAWTLCLELQFYLVFVVMLVLIQWLPINRWAARFFVLVPMSVFSVFVGMGSWDIAFVHKVSGVPGLFVASWYLFFLGVLTKWVLVDGLPMLLGAVFPAFMLVVALTNGEGVFPEENHSAIAALVTVVAFVVAAQTATFGNGLGIGWIAYLGRISYSLYLTHYTVGTRFIQKIQEWYGAGAEYQVPAAIIGFGLSLVAAELLYRAVEKPSVDLAGRAKHWRWLRTS